jgi:hypothetical protein
MELCSHKYFGCEGNYRIAAHSDLGFFAEWERLMCPGIEAVIDDVGVGEALRAKQFAGR